MPQSLERLKTKMKNKLVIYTDGSTRIRNQKGALNKGGYGFVVYNDWFIVTQPRASANFFVNCTLVFRFMKRLFSLNQKIWQTDSCVSYLPAFCFFIPLSFFDAWGRGNCCWWLDSQPCFFHSHRILSCVRWKKRWGLSATWDLPRPRI